jgi:hypothetical protein
MRRDNKLTIIKPTKCVFSTVAESKLDFKSFGTQVVNREGRTEINLKAK